MDLPDDFEVDLTVGSGDGDYFSGSGFSLAEDSFYPLDVLGCGCADPENCKCPADGGGMLSRVYIFALTAHGINHI